MRKIRRIIKWLMLFVILVYLVEPARASVPLALSLQAMESMRSTLIAVFLAEPAQAYVPPVQSARANCYYSIRKAIKETAFRSLFFVARQIPRSSPYSLYSRPGAVFSGRFTCFFLRMLFFWRLPWLRIASSSFRKRSSSCSSCIRIR